MLSAVCPSGSQVVCQQSGSSSLNYKYTLHRRLRHLNLGGRGGGGGGAEGQVLNKCVIESGSLNVGHFAAQREWRYIHPPCRKCGKVK